MESIGEKLKTTREGLGQSVEQIARETNIARRYIVALEEENFDAFPGEPYLIGFLRTYSDTLGLDPKEIIGLYKNFKIQEQPLPMEELIEPKKPSPLWIVLAVVIVIAGLGVGGYFLYPSVSQYLAERREAKEAERLLGEKASQSPPIPMENEILERRFKEGDQILISLEGEEYILSLKKVADDLSLGTPLGDITITLGEEKLLDLNEDGSKDITVFLRDIDTRDPENGVILRFDKFTQAAGLAKTQSGEGEETATGELPGPESGEEAGPGSSETVPEIGTTSVLSRRDKPKVIMETAAPEAFSLNMVFRGYCLLRYLSDGRTREERYFHKGETFRLDVNREVMLWISNAGSFIARIAGQEIDMGRPGEVATKLIKWGQDEDSGLYQLQVIPVY